MTPEEHHARRAIRVLSRCFWAAVIAVVAVSAWQAPGKAEADLKMYQEFQR